MSEDFIEQCCDKASECISQGNYEKARKYLEKAVNRDPGNSKVISLLQILESCEKSKQSKKNNFHADD